MPLFKRRSTEDAIRIFYAADIHGSETCYKKFLNAARFYDANLIILGGDITGKALVTVVELPDGTFQTEFLGREVVASNEAELEDVLKQIRFNGFYPYRCSPDELHDLQRDDALRGKVFEDCMTRETKRWMDLATERLADSGIRCLAMPGNDDGQFVSDVLSDAPLIENCDQSVVDVDGLQVVSLGYSNPTPWNSPRELSEEDISSRIKALRATVDDAQPVIFNLHVPPFNSGLDNAPAIKEDLSLVGGAHARYVPVGSKAVRTAIEEYHPLLALHGHIHESRGTAKIEGTVCVNPGSEYNVGTLRGVVITLTPTRVVGHQFVAA
jgi:uncharacterized protein